MTDKKTPNSQKGPGVISHWRERFRDKGWAAFSIRGSLVNRILFTQLVWTTTVFSVFAIGIWLGLGIIVDKGIDRQAQQLARELDTIGTRLYVSRKRNLPELKKQMAHWEEFSYVRYLNSKAKSILYSYYKTKDLSPDYPLPGKKEITASNSDKEHTRPLRLQDDFGGALVRYLVPIHIRKMGSRNILDFDPDKKVREQVKTIGYIEFGINRSRYSESLTMAVYSAVAGILVLFVVSLFVGRLIIIRALAPLSQLKDPLARLARGERNLLVENTGDEELDSIIEALNITINAVRERDNSLRRMAEYDSLTGLANRSYFTTELENEVSRMTRQEKTSALFFIDLDQFKYINDTLGHAAGDRLLTQVAKSLTTRMRDSDLIARFGGDEFTVLARDIDLKNATSLANSLLSMLREMRFVEGDSTLHIHCSIGLTMIDSGRFSAQEFLAQADMACHQAKTQGRNRVAVYTEGEDGQSKMMADMSWSQSILDALEKDRFILHYQPIVGGDRDKTERYEVLIRLKGEGKELIAPNAFISSAERFGLMPKIDCWVIKHAMARLAEKRAAGRNIQFFINLSGHIFKDTGMLKFVRELLNEHKLPGNSLCFEITEQVAVQHLEEASLWMRSLQKLGCEFALDDFGAGFSSLNYVKSLSIDYIKIDGSFISNMRHDPIDEAMVKSFVQIGKTLGKKTIAEFVENQETLRMLKKLGVDYLQGFHVGSPADDICEKPLTLRKIKARSE
jgi:diguanylate cyclase (GGDEF)-like protein